MDGAIVRRAAGGYGADGRAGAASGGEAVEHTYPCGLRVEFPPFARLETRAARSLADHNSPVFLRGL